MLWIGLGVLGVLAILVLLAYIFLWDKRTLQERMQQEDGDDALLRWVRCVYSLVQYADLGRQSSSVAQSILARDWECQSADHLNKLLEERFALAHGNAAWDLVRAVLLTRLGTAAGFLTEQEGTALLTRAKRALQERFDDWEVIGNEYADARLAWQHSTGQIEEDDDDPYDEVRDSMTQLRKELWPHVPFRG